MKYMITGGAGFIGSAIVHRLVDMKQEVVIIDDFCTGNINNIKDVKDKIKIVKASITDKNAVESAIKGCDYVLHQAALPSVPRSIKDPISSEQTNILGTLNVLLAARDNHVKRVVFASSSSVYGDNPALKKHEKLPTDPLSPYAITKLSCEQFCKVFADLYGLHTVSLRYFNVFGPRQDPTSQYSAVIPLFITGFLKSRPITVFGDGEQSRDFTFVENNVDANLLACTANIQKGTIMNIATGTAITLNELIDMIKDITGKDTTINYTKPRPGDIKHSLADITYAKRFGYDPKIMFKEGLKKTIKWYR